MARGFKCADCGADHVKLYRSYGMFLRDEDIQCNKCIGENTSWRVPVVATEDGQVWGYTSATEEDCEFFYNLPECDPEGRVWRKGEYTRESGAVMKTEGWWFADGKPVNPLFK